MQHNDNIRRRPAKSKKPATNKHQKPTKQQANMDLFFSYRTDHIAYQQLI
jgi:hypothetical protein